MRFIPDTDPTRTAMSTTTPDVSICITPMHRTQEGIWESGAREGASFYLVELVQDEGEDVEVVMECRDERSAALAARASAATLAVLGLGDAEGDVAAFDEQTAAILSDNPTPEIAAASGAWQAESGEEEDEEAGPAPDSAGKLPS
jgi:hypothetical protein